MSSVGGQHKANNRNEQPTASRVENSFRQHATRAVSIICFALGCISIIIPLIYGVAPWTGVVFTLITYGTYRLSLNEKTFRLAATILVVLLGLTSLAYAVVHGIYGALSFFLVLLTGIVASMTLSQQTSVIIFVLEGIVMIPLAVYQHINHHVFATDSVIPDTLMALIVSIAVYFVIRTFSIQLTQLQGREHAQLKELSTYNKKMEVVLEERVKQLEEAVEERTHKLRSLAQRGKELSHLTHDVSNTLTSLRLALDQNLTNIPEKDRENIDKSFEYLRTILQGTSKQKSNQKKCSVLEVVTTSQKLLEKQLRIDNIILQASIEDVQVAMSAAHLQRILDNLLHNSCDALKDPLSKNKQNIIEVVGKMDGPLYELSVRDNGIGIQEDLVSLVREPWFSTKGDDHMGMGLSSITELLQIYPHTSFQLESKYRHYTKVTLKLPVWQPTNR